MKKTGTIFLTLTLAVLTPRGDGLWAQTGDTDGDGVDASIDNCVDLYNAHQTDQDQDGVGDACDDTTLSGRFSAYLTGSDEDRPLRKRDGTPILPEAVPALYGTPDGMTLYDNGVDICSWEYAATKGFERPLRPLYQDLSDGAGWPEIHVTPGTVAIDPLRGRFHLAAGDSGNLKLTGTTWTGFGVPGSGFLRIQGNHAVMPAGEGDFQVLDISDVTNPMVVGHLRVDFNWVAAVYGNYAYISQGSSSNGLSAIDLSDPTNPRWAKTKLWPGYANDIVIRDGRAYVTGGSEPGFHVLDLSAPLAPVEVGSVNVGDPAGAQWIFLSGNRAYVGLASANGLVDRSISYGPRAAGFSVIDVADPVHPTLLGTYLGEPEAPPQIGGLLAFYPFDNGGAVDASGNGYDGAIHGATQAAGYEGGAFSFDGVDDFIWAPVNLDPIKYPKVTFGAWVNAASLPAWNGWGGIISPADTQWDRLLGVDNRWVGGLKWSAWRGSWAMGGDTAVSNQWVFLAVVYDAPAATVTLYTNDHVYTGTGTPGAGWDSLYIGRSSVYAAHFNGLIDNVFVFADALDSSQIAAIRQGGAQAIADLGATLPASHAEPTPLARQKLPRLIGVAGNLAIMAEKWIPANYPLSQPARLVLVDASDPAQIKRVGSYAFQNDLRGETSVDFFSAVASGNRLYVTDDSYDYTQDSLSALPWASNDPSSPTYWGYNEDYTSLLTFDITNPASPLLIDRYDHPQPSRFRHLTLEGGNLFVNDYNYGVRTFSLADPDRPSLVGGALTAAEGHYAWTSDDGSTAFLAQTFGGTLYALDIRDPAAPTLLGSYWDGEWNEKQPFTGRGHYLYVPTATRINIIDVADPFEMVRVGEFPTTAQGGALSLFGERAYVLTAKSRDFGVPPRHQVNIYDISNPAQPVLLNGGAPVDLVTQQQAIFAQGRYVYVMSTNCLTIVDAADPAAPSVVGQLTDPNLTVSLGGEPEAIQVRDGYAYIATGLRTNKFFHIVDVSDKAHPSYVKTYTHTSSRHMTNIIVDGNYLFLGSYYGAFFAYDITNPIAPIYLGNAGDLDLGGWEAAWSMGGLVGEQMAVPTISHFELIDVPRAGQGLIGPTSVAANLNRPPVACVEGPYAVAEGGEILLQGWATDPDGDPLVFTWDLDADGIGETSGETVVYSAVGRDGPATHVVALRVCDDSNECVTNYTTVNVLNAAPSVEALTVPLHPIAIHEQALFSIGATFSDPAGPLDAPYTCNFFLHGATMGSDATQTGVAGVACQTALAYDAPGVYSATVEVADKDFGKGSRAAAEYIVIYDADGGFVTGGGWIDSPAGACQLAGCELATGKANFGFVSKYKNGASVPSGNTQFQFKAGNLNFQASVYEWLVVSGARARYKGVGAINGGAQDYKFMLTAIDADVNLHDQHALDRFRIKIWREAAGAEIVAYDNALSGSDEFDDQTLEQTSSALGGGSIVIHGAQ